MTTKNPKERTRARQKKYPYVPKGSPLELPPCKICNGKASGIHYGVNSCEACKGFFRRYLLRKEPYKCLFGGECEISDKHRGNCSACRMQKCLNLGMSKEGIRQGRYTLTERTKAIMEVKKLQGKETSYLGIDETSLPKKNLDYISVAVSEKTSEKCSSNESPSSSNSLLSTDLDELSPSIENDQNVIVSENISEMFISPENIDFSIVMTESMQQNLSSILESNCLTECLMPYEKLNPPPQLSVLMQDITNDVGTTIVAPAPPPQVMWNEESYDDYVEELVRGLNDMRPHSSELTDEEIKNILQEGHDKYSLKTELFGPLNALSPEEYNDIYERTNLDVDGRKQYLLKHKDIFELIIRKYVGFAHMIKGFSDLPANDQATLLKASRFEFFMLLEYRSLDPDLEMMLTYTGEVFHVNEACMYVPKEMMKSWLEFTRHIKRLELTAKELAVTLAISLTFRDRCKLSAPDHVENIQMNLINILLYLLGDHHGDESTIWFTRIMSMFISLRSLTENYLTHYKYLCSDRFLKKHVPEILEFVFDEWYIHKQFWIFFRVVSLRFQQQYNIFYLVQSSTYMYEFEAFTAECHIQAAVNLK